MIQESVTKQIIRMYDSGKKIADIAEAMEMSFMEVNNVILNHVPDKLAHSMSGDVTATEADDESDEDEDENVQSETEEQDDENSSDLKPETTRVPDKLKEFAGKELEESKAQLESLTADRKQKLEELENLDLKISETRADIKAWERVLSGNT